MRRSLILSFVTLALAASGASAQEGILSRTGRAIDNAGRGIRNAVETGVAQGQVNTEEREVLTRVMRRIEWDKHLAGSPMQYEVRPGGIVVLRGSVPSPIHKSRAVNLASSTVGVSTVVDELAVVKEVKVIKSEPATRKVETTTPAVVPSPPAATGTTVIEKP